LNKEQKNYQLALGNYKKAKKHLWDLEYDLHKAYKQMQCSNHDMKETKDYMLFLNRDMKAYKCTECGFVELKRAADANY